MYVCMYVCMYAQLNKVDCEVWKTHDHPNVTRKMCGRRILNLSRYQTYTIRYLFIVHAISHSVVREKWEDF